METLLSVLVGIGLSAACGFRIFVPPLVISIAALSGHLHLASGFEWMGTYPAMTAFGVACALEIAAYYVPWLDHMLDILATPTAVVAGTIVTASLVTDMSPMLRWTLAIIAGGGAAGLIQGATVATRALSTATTGGIGNPVVATAELGGSLGVSLVAILAPLLGLLLILVVAGWLLTRFISKPPPQVS